jgi:hypothetical protein
VWWCACSKSDEPIAWDKTNPRTDLKVLPYNNLPSVVDGNGAGILDHIISKFSLYYYAVVTLAPSPHVCCDRLCEMQGVVGQADPGQAVRHPWSIPGDNFAQVTDLSMPTIELGF